jgi:hypothetical protein
MTEGLRLSDIAALERLAMALGRFTETGQATLAAVKQDIQATEAWIQARHDYWKREVVACEQRLLAAERSLDNCRRSGWVDDRGVYHPPDCRVEAREVTARQIALREARAELQKVRQWEVRINHAIEQVRGRLPQLRQLMTERIGQGHAFLLRKAAAYRAAAYVVSNPLIGLKVVILEADRVIGNARQSAVRHARKEEIALVQATGRGTRDWTPHELALMQERGVFPKGYIGHHVNNVQRFPDLMDNPDNIQFVTHVEHLAFHQGDWHNNTSGRMFNRKSLLVQWEK